MRIGKLFHLTPLVDDIVAAERFFNSIFSPICTMQGYSAHWHRHGAIFIIADTSIEPMQPLAPAGDEAATSWFRYMDRNGPHIHNMAFYVDDAPELERRLNAAGVRTTGAGRAETVFAHPKDTPGMLEFLDSAHAALPEPRFSPHWPAFRDDFWPHRHPLGLEGLSHLTVVVNDLEAATRFYTDVLDAVRLDGQVPSEPDVDGAFVLVGEDTVVELVQPLQPSSFLGQELASVGQCVVGVTFKVRDLEQAAEHLRLQEAPVAAVEDRRIVLDRTKTWGAEYRFTDKGLRGDPRQHPIGLGRGTNPADVP